MYCIYQITNKINGKRYIGQHKYENEANPMGKYKGSGVILHKAYKKYGIENFETEILYKRIRDKATINAMEIWAIEKYKPEYNIAKGGSGGDIYHQLDEEGKNRMVGSGSNNPFYGHHHSEETKRRISEVMKGKEGHFKGKHHSEETKEKNRMAHLGKKPNLGKKFSEETRRNMSVAHKGKPSKNKGRTWKLIDGKRVYSDK